VADDAEAPDDATGAVDLVDGMGVGVGDERMPGLPGQALRRTRLQQLAGRAPGHSGRAVLPHDAVRREPVLWRSRPIVGPAHLDHTVTAQVVGDEHRVVRRVRGPIGVGKTIDAQPGVTDDPVLPDDPLFLVDREHARRVTVGDEGQLPSVADEPVCAERLSKLGVVRDPV